MIDSITVLVNAGTTGLLVVNVRNYLNITNISITVDYTICPTKDEHSEQINAILLYYDNWNNETTNIQLDNFQFTANGTCLHPLQYMYAITLLLFQNNTNVSAVVKNTNFNNMKNVSALYYYGQTCGIFASNILTFKNCFISKNTGYHNFKMFEIILYNSRCFDFFFMKLFCSQQHNNISFINCEFNNNHNITSMIHVTPASSRAITGYIDITESSFCNNSNSHFLILQSNTDNVWQLSNYVFINVVNISSNRHFEGHNLLSATNCWMKFLGPIFITNNSYYENIIQLHLSGAIFEHNITIVNNTARKILYCSYILIYEDTFINVSFNTVYVIVKQTLRMGISSLVCEIEFYSNTGNLDNVTKLPFKTVLLNNIFMTSKLELLPSTNCHWLAGTAFQSSNPVQIFNETFTVQNLVIGNDIKRPIPLSICKCEMSSSGAKSVDCYAPFLGSIFPGETLKIQLIVQEQWRNHDKSPTTILVENSSDEDNCSIVHASQLSQTHFYNINNCNNYSYTLWPKNEAVKECQLFIGLHDMPEMFYVQIKPCPKGFTFQKQRKACHCDPLLSSKLHIKPCSLTKETISHPANSWIYADTDENSHTHKYQVSLYCPFHRCLPKSSHLNLSNPDSQCQYNGTGVLCGKCKPGLSVILGTLQCKHCSSIYLLLLIPFAVTGIVLVIILYIFNITVRSETINTLIFYVNIVNINLFTFFPDCQSITCIIFSYMNLDLRVKTCFYNGLNDYVKEWLHLLHSFYFIIIAILFIVLSRYSAKVQRLTAQRALPVLSSLILFSYTKILLIVCNVSFQYSVITHLPSNKTELVWSVSTTPPLFGMKFLALFIVCIIIFFILFPFNIILLFTRKLSHFKLVTKLKPLLDTYFSAYKDKAFYWTGLLLAIRVIVYILSVFDKDISFITINILLASHLCLHGIMQPFKSKFYNIQESIAIVNLLAAHVLPLYKNSLLGLKVAQVLLEIEAAYFIIAIIIHCCMHRWGSTIYKYIEWLYHKICKITTTVHRKCSIDMESLRNRIADVTYNYREFQEPLVEYDN